MRPHASLLARGFHSGRQIARRSRRTTPAALKRTTRYKNTTDAPADDRDDTKGADEIQYVRQRARLVEILFLWWSDVLRASTGVARRGFPSAETQTEILAQKLTTAEILRRIRRLEEMRDHLGRNIQEALAIEVAFLSVFTF